MYRGNHAEITDLIFAPLQCRNEFVHNIINIDKIHNRIRIIDLDLQTICDVIAEGRHAAVIVRSAPFTEYIRQTIDDRPRTCLLFIGKQQILSGFLALAVGIIEFRLNGGGDQHR